MRATRQRKDARRLRIDKGERRGGMARSEGEVVHRSVEKEEKRAAVSDDNLPWSEDEEGCPRSRDLWLVGEKRENTSNLLLYNARLSVSIQRFQGAQHVGNPHTLHRITLSRKFVRNIMPQLGSDIAVRIYHSGKNEGFPLLSLSCSLALSSSVHYARRPFVTHELE